MRAADGSNLRSVTRNGEPIVHRRPDFSTSQRRVARTRMPSDQQEDAVAGRYCLFQSGVDCAPSAVEASSVQIQRPVRVNVTRPKTAIPVRV
jgi:hypothetical protein